MKFIDFEEKLDRVYPFIYKERELAFFDEVDVSVLKGVDLTLEMEVMI